MLWTPEGVMRLWDVWDIRVLVLLSLSLQIILSIFGHRRKYIPSLWISILVWSAYLMADWVATVALGRMSHAKVDNNNVSALRAIWAPLLLLHLGGPDTITAYSLEDNQLWVRHLLGLVVQLSVSIYVILMSWQHSWFSFLSLPALVAGMIKYGERTWVLKSVTGDKSGHIVPFGRDLLPEVRNDYVGVVTYARFHLTTFKFFMENYDLKSKVLKREGNVADDKFFWNILEVEMGLMYDLLYTKASTTYRKWGCILRCISFICTAAVLEGLIFQVIFMREKEEWHKVDVAITEVLLVGALSLEIYSVIALHLSSDWAMLWLISCNKSEAVIKLRSKIPWLFMRKKNWSNRIGQFDLLSFWLKDVQADQKLSRRILGGLLKIINCKDEFDRYVHSTFVDDFSHLYSAITNYCHVLMRSTVGDVDENSVFNEEREFWDKMGGCDSEKCLFSSPREIIYIHIITEICYHSENDWTPVASEAPGFDEQNRKTTRALSHYMMYLLAIHPSLLSTSKFVLDDTLSSIYEDHIFAFNKMDAGDVREVYHHILSNGYFSSLTVGLNYFKEKPKAERWKILEFVWLRMLCYAAIKCQKDIHLQQLRQGGELLTLLWLFLPQCGGLGSLQLDPGILGPELYEFNLSFSPGWETCTRKGKEEYFPPTPRTPQVGRPVQGKGRKNISPDTPDTPGWETRNQASDWLRNLHT